VFGIDTFIDLEVYSRLSTIFSGLSAARNRIGFYLQEVFWRRDIQTHLVFFNPQSNVYHAYASCAELIGAQPASVNECKNHLSEKISAIPVPENLPDKYVIIGHTCSDLSLERMLSPAQWKITLQRLVKEKIIAKDTPLVFLGAKKDFDKAEAIIREIRPVLKNPFINACGKYRLIESIKIISGAGYFVGIDSALLHYARLLSVPSHSYWGPTNPNALLMPIENYQEEIAYKKVPCSPCTHITEVPPCNGKAFCIQNLFKDDSDEEIFTLIYNQSKDLRNRLNKKSINDL
jgi:ADP-heptose:LPS heptosyltransferase